MLHYRDIIGRSGVFSALFVFDSEIFIGIVFSGNNYQAKYAFVMTDKRSIYDAFYLF